MIELTKKIYKRIRENPIQGLPLGDKFISPQYNGLSILNIPASAAELLNVEGFSSPPILPDLLDPIQRCRSRRDGKLLRAWQSTPIQDRRQGIEPDLRACIEHP